MSNFNMTCKAGNFHVWTKKGNWVAEFSTKEAAELFIARQNKYNALIAYHTELHDESHCPEGRAYQRGMIAAYRLERGVS